MSGYKDNYGAEVVICPYDCEYRTDLGYCKLTACTKTKSETIIMDGTKYEKVECIDDNFFRENINQFA